jgi:phosphatidylserine/phosphatidylglycerophosphate/cardiolipin synthase-like enzyme
MPERLRFESELTDLGLGEVMKPTKPVPTKWLKLFPDAKRNKADFLLDGEAYYKSVIQAMEMAKTKSDYIYILGWMLDIDLQLVNGDKDKTLFKILEKAAKKDVEIRILIWDNLIPGYAKMHNAAIPRLNALPNTKVFIDEHTFFPAASKQLIAKIAPYITTLINKYGKLLFKHGAILEKNLDIPPSYIIYRLLGLINQKTIGAHHEKVVVVKNEEGLTAFCGGIDFNKNRVISTVERGSIKMDVRFPYYHDNACRLQGPAAFDVLEKFKKRWANHPVANKTALRGQSESKPKEFSASNPFAKTVGTFNSLDGKIKDRSLKDAYLKIIENAESYIYIEDQYLVNLEVAQILNKKIKESGFQRLILAIQDSIETADIFIPNRKRGEFFQTVVRGANKIQKEKILLSVLDRTKWDKSFYHPGLHAKTLIVDDEIAIIGSANVNQRSFTCDSETSVVVFDDTKFNDQNFAKRLRSETFKEFLRKPEPKIVYESWFNYVNEIIKSKDFSILTKYELDAQDDLDLRIWDQIKKTGVIGVSAVYKLSGNNLQVTQQLNSQMGIEGIFNIIWEHLIDPVCP